MFKSFRVLLLLLLFAASFLVVVNLNVGYIDLGFQDFFSLSSLNSDIATFRVNRILIMLLVGVSIPNSGFLLQEYFQNPLASPSVLGITSVAGLFVATYLFLFQDILLPEWLQSSFIGIVAVLGSSIFLSILLFVSKKFLDKTYLIIFGFLISSFSGAIISAFQYYGDKESLKNYILWSFGGNNYIDREQILILSILVFLGLWISFKAIKPLIGSSLGDDYARTMGVDVHKLKILIVFSSSLLSASVTAFVGPILFVGIVVPHFCRTLWNPSQLWHQWILNILVGIFVLQFISVLSEVTHLPVNVLTSLFGIPLILMILLRRKK